MCYIHNLIVLNYVSSCITLLSLFCLVWWLIEDCLLNNNYTVLKKTEQNEINKQKTQKETRGKRISKILENPKLSEVFFKS